MFHRLTGDSIIVAQILTMGGHLVLLALCAYVAARCAKE
jgi:hypothetical protein